MAHNERGDLAVAMGAPAWADIARKGDLWSVQIATPIAGIVALPTTLANLEINNNTAERYLAVSHIFSWQLIGTAVVWSHTPWACVGPQVYSANAALVIGGGNGDQITSATNTKIRTAITQTVAANGWQTFPGSSMNFGLAAATPGGACIGDVDGRLIVPPGKSLYVSVTASVNTASAFHVGATVGFID